VQQSVVGPTVSEIDTPSGTARVHLVRPSRSSPRSRSHAAAGLVLLGHGAGGGVSAPDLQLLAQSLPAIGITVGLVEQPYRVAGRRAPAPAKQLDAAFTAVSAALMADQFDGLVVGGRSSGARVACRTAQTLGAVGVLALAFPLRPPWRPEKTRLPELTAVPVPTLVVQGERDHFGTAADLAEVAPPQAQVLPVPGADHSLGRGLDVAAIGAVTAWIETLLNTPGRAGRAAT
jgi:predicted alpha/beta-hydrolase family hydrolase